MPIFRSIFNNFFNAKQKVNFCLLILLMLISSLLEILGISFIIPLIGNLLGDQNLPNSYFSTFFDKFNFLNLISIYNLLFLFLLIFVFKFFFLLYFYYYETRFIYGFKERISSKLFFNYLNKDYQIIKKNSSVLLNNILNEVEQVTVYLDALAKYLLDIIVVTGLVIFLLYYNFYVSISIISVLFSFIFFHLVFFKKRINSWGSQRLDSANRRIQYLNEGITGNKTIKIFNSENFFYLKFLDYNKLFKNISIKISFLQNVPKVLLELLGILSLLSVIIYALQSNYGLNSIIQLLGVFLFAFFKIVPSLNRIVGNLQIMRYLKVSVDLIIDEKVKQDFSNSSKEAFNFENDISLKINNFSYRNSDSKISDGDILIKNIDLKINKNEKIGIVGPSGAGKSTLLDIFSGLIVLEKDSVFVDNKSIYPNTKGWQKNIGYVPQKTFIIEDTLKNNILFGIDEKKISDTFFDEILSKSNLFNLVNRLPKGVNTIIKEEGHNFSGGEVQRIGLARAFIRKPKILILDEATSSLDTKNENEIIQDLLKITNLTIISVTHRHSALKSFNKIYNLDKGSLDLVE